MRMIYVGLIWSPGRRGMKKELVLKLEDKNFKIHTFDIFPTVSDVLGWKNITVKRFNKLITTFKDRDFSVVRGRICNLSKYIEDVDY